MARQRPAPFAQVNPNGRGNPPRGKAKMTVKPFILGRNDGILQMGRDRLRIHRTAVILPTPGKGEAIAVHKGY